MNTFKSILSSNWLFAALCISIAAFGLMWAQTYRADTAPTIAGVDWGQHSKSVLLLVPPKDCGCGMKPLAMAREAAAHGVDLVMASSGPNSNIDEVKNAHIKGSQIVTAEVTPDLIKCLCPQDKATALRIHNGRVTLTITGNLPSDFFDRFES